MLMSLRICTTFTKTGNGKDLKHKRRISKGLISHRIKKNFKMNKMTGKLSKEIGTTLFLVFIENSVSVISFK